MDTERHTTVPVAPQPSRIRRGLLVVVLVVVVVLLWLLVWPPTARPARADAVVVLAGPSARLDRGLALVRSGVAPVLVVSNGDQPGWVRGNALCDEPQPFEVVCFRPSPQSTAGEARAIARLAEQEGWRDVVVVTSPSHVTRARVLVGQCTDVPVSMVTHDLDLYDRLRPGALVRETLGLLAGTTVARAC